MSINFSSRDRLLPWIVATGIFVLIIISSVKHFWVVPWATAYSKHETSIYSGSFYAVGDSNLLALSKGISGPGLPSIFRTGQTVVPWHDHSDLKLYALEVGDSICVENHCFQIKAAMPLAVAIRSEGAWWSTRRLDIGPWDALPLATGVSLRVTSETELLFVSQDQSRSEVTTLHPGRNHFKLSVVPELRPVRIVYFIAFSLLSAFAAFHFVCSTINVPNSLSRSKFSRVAIAIICIQLLLQYIIVFPGIFNTDIVLPLTFSDGFSIWFSSAYMVYAIGLSPLYPLLIQLPQVLAYAASCVYLIGALKSRTAFIAFFILQIFSPAIFAMLFSQQRIFVAGTIVFAAIAVSFVNLKIRQRIGWVGCSLLITAGLMRDEYWLFFFAFLAVQVFFTSKHKIKTLALPVTVAIVVGFFVNIVLPAIYEVDKEEVSSRYRMATMLDVVRPYAGCSGSAPVPAIEEAIAVLGSLEEYCENTPEVFYWSSANGAKPETVINAIYLMRQAVISAVLSDPLPSFGRAFERLWDILTQSAWQIIDRYQKDQSSPPSVHAKYADSLGLVPHYSIQERPASLLIQFYVWISSTGLNLVWFIYILLIVPFIAKDNTLQLLNACVILIGCFAALASPTVNWSYTLIVPLWGILTVPLIAISRQKNH